MTARRFSLWQKVVAFAPLLLLLVYLPGQMMLRCRLDGRVRAVCCCPQEDNPGESSGPVLRAQDCCDRQLTRGGERPVAEAVRAAGDHDAAALASVVIAVVPSVEPTLPRAGGRGRARRSVPAYDGPPLVLLKHAFLI